MEKEQSSIFGSLINFVSNIGTTNQDFVVIDNDVCEKITKKNNDPTISPLVFEETKGFFTRQENFNCHQHPEVINAMYNGRAFYYTKHQGAIIYNNEEPLTIEQVQPIKDLLETLLNPNQKTTCSYRGRRRHNPHEIKPGSNSQITQK
jgi:hypothetical protein